MKRSVPASLAPVVERLELDQPQVVALQQLTKIGKEAARMGFFFPDEAAGTRSILMT